MLLYTCVAWAREQSNNRRTWRDKVFIIHCHGAGLLLIASSINRVRLPSHSTNRSMHYSLAPHNDISANDGLHKRRWSHEIIILKKVKWSRCRPGVAQRVSRGIAILFHDRGIRRGWMVSSTPRPHFTHGKDPVPILQEAGWAPGPVWTGGKYRPYRDSIPDCPARSQTLYRWTELPDPQDYNIIIFISVLQ